MPHVVNLSNGPLTHSDLHDYVDDSGRIRAYVPVELDEMIGADLEAFQDRLSTEITGSSDGLADVCYEPHGIEGGGLILVVQGKVEFGNLGDCTDACDLLTVVGKTIKAVDMIKDSRGGIILTFTDGTRQSFYADSFVQGNVSDDDPDPHL